MSAERVPCIVALRGAQRLCKCGHWSADHGVPAHECPDCECGSEEGACNLCKERGDGDCTEMRPVRLAARALTPLDEWRAYKKAMHEHE